MFAMDTISEVDFIWYQ